MILIVFFILSPVTANEVMPSYGLNGKRLPRALMVACNDRKGRCAARNDGEMMLEHLLQKYNRNKKSVAYLQNHD